MITVVRFHPDDDWYVVSFAYNPEVVSVIKSVPSFGRTWMPAVKQWRLHSLFTSELASTLRGSATSSPDSTNHLAVAAAAQRGLGCCLSGSVPAASTPYTAH
jgi:hypothetical protein